MQMDKLLLISRSKFAALIRLLKFPRPDNWLNLSALIGRLRFSSFIGRIGLPSVLHKTNTDWRTELLVQPDLSVLNCRVQLVRDEKDAGACDTFAVEICGSIHTPGDMRDTTLKITIADVSDTAPQAGPVLSKVKQWQMTDSPVFCYNAELGRLPEQDVAVPDWTAVARIHVDWLMFPRNGKRDLQFRTSVLSRRSNEELACAECTFTYENTDFGYVDLEENHLRTRTLAVALAFAVSAADNKLFNCEVDLIKSWARENIGLSQASDRTRRKLEEALNETVAFFRNGNRLNIFGICKEIVEIAPIADRYDILDFCLHVARTKGSVAAEELAILNDLAGWLKVDAARFREMAEKIVPVGMHEVRDTEVVLGVTSNMGKEGARRHLNREYSKWNARITNSDPEIQAQANQMLKLIAEARRQYVG